MQKHKKCDRMYERLLMNITAKQLVYNHFLFRNPHSHSEGFMMHSHNTYELIFFEKGEATYIIENKKYQLKKNDLILIRPLKHHYIEVSPNSEYARYSVAFSPALIGEQLVDKIPKEIEVINCPKESVIAHIFDRMDYYNANLEENSFLDVLGALLKEIFYVLSLSNEDMMNIPSEISPILTQALEYINNHLFSIKDIKEISSQFFITEQYFFRLFQTQLKTTPKKYLLTKRLLSAQKEIQRGKRPIDVYLECGFETYVGFYKQYVKTFGYSPSKEKQIQTF